MGRLGRGELALHARLLAVTERTLRKWRARAEDSPLLMGRPRHTRETWRAAVVPVARAWKSQGFSSGRGCVLEAMEQAGIDVPVAIVRALLKELKVRRRSYLGRKKAGQRQHVEVHARDALWSEDATHLGRDEHGKVEALAVKDVGTTTAIEESVGGAARGEDVLALLERAKPCEQERARVLVPRGRARDRALERAVHARAQCPDRELLQRAQAGARGLGRALDGGS